MGVREGVPTALRSSNCGTCVRDLPGRSLRGTTHGGERRRSPRAGVGAGVSACGGETAVTDPPLTGDWSRSLGCPHPRDGLTLTGRFALLAERAGRFACIDVANHFVSVPQSSPSRSTMSFTIVLLGGNMFTKMLTGMIAAGALSIPLVLAWRRRTRRRPAQTSVM